MSSIAVALCLVTLAFIGWSYRKGTTSGLSIPPGPKPLPLLGNWLDFPTDKIWLAYNRWSQTYGKILPLLFGTVYVSSHETMALIGDVVCLRALGEHIIVLDSAKAVSDLFERRSAIYSDRPRKPVLDMCVPELSEFCARPPIVLAKLDLGSTGRLCLRGMERHGG